MRSIVTLLSRVRPSFRGSFVRSLVAVIGVAALSGAASGALPALVGAALSAIVPAGAAPASPGTMSSGLAGLANLPAWAVVAIAFAGTFGTVALAVLSSRLGSQLSGELTAALRIEMLRRVLGASPREVERAGREMVEQRGGPAPPPGVKLPEARGGEAVKLAIARESGLVADFVIAALTGLPQALVTLLVLTAELALGGRWLVLVGGAGLFLLSRLAAARASRRVAEATQGMQREDVRVFADLGEKLTLTEDLRLAGAREQAGREFAEAAHRAADARSHFARALAVSGQIKSVFSAMSPLVILLALRLGDATPDAGQVAKLLLYVPLLIARFEGLDGIRMGFEERRRVIHATLALLSLPASPEPSAQPIPLTQLKDTTLVLEGVRFTPKGSTKPILDGLSLTIPDGAIVGIAGPRGAANPRSCGCFCAWTSRTRAPSRWAVCRCASSRRRRCRSSSACSRRPRASSSGASRRTSRWASIPRPRTTRSPPRCAPWRCTTSSTAWADVASPPSFAPCRRASREASSGA
jgi:ABC-type multidrug transport system fused ATPase/permease subunit